MHLQVIMVVQMHQTGSSIYLARHGQTYYNLEDRMGGDSDLAPEGIKNAEAVSRILKDIQLKEILFSDLQMSYRTAVIIAKRHVKAHLIKMPELREISSGDMDSITYEEFREYHLIEHKARMADKYHWAFPNGESYETMMQRVAPLLDRLKKKGNLLIVGHQGINRVIIKHLAGNNHNISEDDVPYIVIPHETVFEIGMRPPYGISRLQEGGRHYGIRIRKDGKEMGI